MLGPDALQIAFDNDAGREIQKKLPEEFASDYQRFVLILEEYFADTYLDKLSAYDSALQASRLERWRALPGIPAFHAPMLWKC